ncbi:MAG: hypothetical protein WD045_12065 [Pirellulaceae bacterium]
MSYNVSFSLEAVEDVLHITLASQAKSAIVNASKQLQEALQNDPAGAGEHLSEGLYYIDREPLRAFYIIQSEDASVEIVNVRQL